MMERLKKVYPYIGALFGIFMIPYILITTPSLHEFQRKFVMMNSDLQQMVDNHGVVASRRELNKYGVASLSVEVAGQLLDGKKLAELGWISIDQSGARYCKDGVLLSTYPSDQLFMGEKMVNVDFRYTTKTISTCGNARENR